MQKHHSLYEVLQSVQRMFERYWNKPVWIKAELAKLNFYPHSGHAYPLLVEKRESKSIAEIRSTIWSSTLELLKRKFEGATKQEFNDGIEVLILCEVKYSPSHGMSLNIIDLDPSFTLGKMEQERLECIKKLKEENIFDLNKKLVIPSIPKRVAVISVETSKGYKDFLETLAQYKKFHFDLELFPALLQGDKAVESIVNQLKAINNRSDEFDLVAIIRGGGGEVGLSCYDNYLLSKTVATFSLPIISGIGHASNLTVVEMVSNFNLITPTALANFLIEKYLNFEERIDDASQNLKHAVSNLLSTQNEVMKSLQTAFKSEPRIAIQRERHLLNSLSTTVYNESNKYLRSSELNIYKRSREIIYASHNSIEQSRQNIDRFKYRLETNSKQIISKQHREISYVENKVKLLSPDEVLKRGFSITRLNGKVSELNNLKVGDIIETQTVNKAVSSEVKEIKNKS